MQMTDTQFKETRVLSVFFPGYWINKIVVLKNSTQNTSNYTSCPFVIQKNHISRKKRIFSQNWKILRLCDIFVGSCVINDTAFYYYKKLGIFLADRFFDITLTLMMNLQHANWYWEWHLFNLNERKFRNCSFNEVQSRFLGECWQFCTYNFWLKVHYFLDNEAFRIPLLSNWQLSS